MFVIALGSLWACASTAAPAPTSTPASAAPMSAAAPAPFLWEVKRGDAISYAFGTIHAGVSLEELPPDVLDKLSSSRALVVETDTSGAALGVTMKMTMLPADQSLRAMLGEAYWSVLVEHLGDSMAESALDRFRPWMVGVLITLRDVITPGQISMDEALVKRARSAGKQLVYLETVEEQLTILNEVMDLQSLKETLDDVPRARHVLQTLIRAYRHGNLAALTGIMLNADEMKNHPERIETLLFARNRRWMTALKPLFDHGSVFVAVGAGHYVGDDGLIELLRADGYEVRRVDGVTVQ